MSNDKTVDQKIPYCPLPLFTKKEIQQLVDKFRLALYGRSQVTLIPHNPDPHKAECVTV